MRRTISFAFVFLQILLLVNATGFYTIVAPGTIQSNYEYDVSVTLHDSPEPAKIKVGITGKKYNNTQTVDVASGETKVVHFDIPQLEDGDYKLETEGVKGLTFKNSTELVYKNEGPKVYIQTDKAVYKPGDLVQYRILALDENTRPAKLHEPLNVGIRDGAGNHIKQLNDIQMTKGVYAGEFQLSEQPVLGNWVLDVTAGKENKAKTEKNFEVAKYVLPKFSVEIETAKDVAIYDGVIKITVRSKYTYGKPVKGKATVSIASSSRTQAAEKTIDVDGKGHLEFDMVKDLKLDRSQFDSMSQNQFRYYGYLPPLEVLAVVTEGYTGNSQNKTTSINLEPSRYRINVPQNVYEYVPKKPFEIKAYVQKLDGSPVRDAKTKAKLSIKRQSYYWMPAEDKIKADYVYESDVKDDGSVLFTVTIPDTGYYGDVTIQYEEKTHYLPGIRSKEEEKSSDDKSGEKKEESFGPLKIVKKSESYKLSDDVEFEVKSDDPMPYFVYVITGRGKILEQKYVALEDNVKSHKVSLKPTFDMVPNAKVYAYYVKNGDLKFNEATINFSDDFENKIEITAPEQAKPSEEVTLNIKADPDSFIGLMGVDQSVLLLKAGNDLDPKSIKSDLNSYDTRTPYIRGWGDYPGKESGLVTLTNANYPYNEEYPNIRPFFRSQHILLNRGGIPQSLGPVVLAASPVSKIDFVSKSPSKPKIRKDFAETWIFSAINNTDASGMAKLSKKIPDTITSWVVTGFAMNEKTGFAMAENPTKIKVFQPFFISTNLPYSVKRGEVISIPIVVFNYMEKSLDAEVTMENTDEEYDFTEATNDIEESVLEEKQRTKSITVPSNGGQTVSFMIRPNKVGDITLKIKAISALAGDAIHQKLKVEPEGVTHYENHAIFVNIPDKQGLAKHELQAPIPKDAVLDSEYLEFSAVGDILGPTIKNIDKLVRMPYGCGEQNMVNFVPNILVLYYLDAIKKDMPLIAQKAKSYMESGYQRELTYKHKNGAYSAFGEGRSEDNSWLTAYVARSFIQARKYITIDAAVIDQALEFLAKTQAEDGHFPQKGKLFHPAHQNDVGFTAFALLAFLEDTDYAAKYKPQIQKALQYLADHIDKENNIYALAIAGVVLNKVHHPDASKLMDKLEKSSTFENGLKWWSNANKDHSNDIEVTSYILQSLVETEEAGKLLPIIQWLVGQRNSLGGFDSTQDTVVGLQALIKFAERFMAVGGGDGKMSIAFEAKDGEGHETTKDTIEVDKDNALLLQTHVLLKSSRQVSMTATGQGSCLVQLSYRYNLATKDDKPSFAIKHELKKTPTPHQLLMNVCAEYQPGPDSQLKESNMAVMEISLPSGFTADSDSFDEIRNANQVQRVETKNSETVIIVYFESLKAAEPVCFDVFAEKSHAVAKQKPAAITVYDYYNTEQRATVYYEVKSSLCDICEKDECGQGCSK